MNRIVVFTCLSANVWSVYLHVGKLRALCLTDTDWLTDCSAEIQTDGSHRCLSIASVLHLRDRFRLRKMLSALPTVGSEEEASQAIVERQRTLRVVNIQTCLDKPGLKNWNHKLIGSLKNGGIITYFIELHQFFVGTWRFSLVTSFEFSQALIIGIGKHNSQPTTVSCQSSLITQWICTLRKCLPVTMFLRAGLRNILVRGKKRVWGVGSDQGIIIRSVGWLQFVLLSSKPATWKCSRSFCAAETIRHVFQPSGFHFFFD